MGRFIRSRSVERYWRLLDRVTNQSERQRILELIVEKRQNQRDASVLAVADRSGSQAECRSFDIARRVLAGIVRVGMSSPR